VTHAPRRCRHHRVEDWPRPSAWIQRSMSAIDRNGKPRPSLHVGRGRAFQQAPAGLRRRPPEHLAQPGKRPWPPGSAARVPVRHRSHRLASTLATSWRASWP
jgi:hypothetical protein